MLKPILTDLKKYYVNFRGWSTNRKIVVIESDDWGSIRTHSKSALENLKNKGIDMTSNLFNAYDVLESKQDLQKLFSFLSNFKDSHGNHPVITANTILANPDFKTIEKNGFQDYAYEDFTTTYKRLNPGEDIINYWRSEGMEKKRLLWPQLHGREHFNYQWWMAELKNGNENELSGFYEESLLGLPNKDGIRSVNGYMAALDMEKEKDLPNHGKVIQEGVELFEKIFGFKSSSFVAPCSIRSDQHDPYLVENGLNYHQMGQQVTPCNEAYKTINRFWGDRNKLGQIYWRRNSSFEPYRGFENRNYKHRVLEDAKIAFRCGKPLVINSHRINYVGGIEEQLPKYTYELLEETLNSLLKKYPDIEFMSSDQLGDLIASSVSK